MQYVFIVPSWFNGFDILLQLCFGIFALILAAYAFKIYRLSDQEQLKLFSIAFFSIAISYLIQVAVNSIIFYGFDDVVISMINLNRLFLLQLFGLYLHALFFSIGVIFLTYMTLKIKNYRVLSLLIILTLVSVLFSVNKLFLFYALCTVLLFYTVIYYLMHYVHQKKTGTLFVLFGMFFLFMSSLTFMLALNTGVSYVWGHVFELIAYVLLFVNLFMVLKNGKKTR